MARFSRSSSRATTPFTISISSSLIADYEKAIAAQSGNAQFHNHLAHALLYREMFRDGALESELVSGNNSFIRRPKLEPPPDVEKRFFAEIDRSMQLSQAAVARNPRDTVALHTLSVALALRANYGFLVRKSWRASLYDSSQARKYDNQVTEIDPGDYDARLLQGGYDYIVGSLSWTLRALGFIAGYHGDKQRGLRTIEEVAQKGKQNRVDAEIVLCALYRREGQPTRAIPLVSQLIRVIRATICCDSNSRRCMPRRPAQNALNRLVRLRA